MYKIHQYRSQGIQEEYKRNSEIEPIWLQTLGTAAVTSTVMTREVLTSIVVQEQREEGDPDLKQEQLLKEVTEYKYVPVTTTITPALNYIEFDKINSADDVNVSGCDCILGKKVIPSIVSLPGEYGSMHDRGLYRVASVSRQLKYYPTTINRFYSYVCGSSRAKHDYYWRIGNTLYIHPYRKMMSVILILDNPLSNGLLTTDQYPLSFTLAEYVIMKILTQDFNIEAKMAGDLRNDAADALISLQRDILKSVK